MRMPTDTEQHRPAVDEELWDDHMVHSTTGLGRSTRRRMVEAGTFPTPIVIGVMRGNGKPGRIAWLKSEVLGWIAEQASGARVDWAAKKAAAGAQAGA